MNQWDSPLTTMDQIRLERLKKRRSLVADSFRQYALIEGRLSVIERKDKERLGRELERLNRQIHEIEHGGTRVRTNPYGVRGNYAIVNSSGELVDVIDVTGSQHVDDKMDGFPSGEYYAFPSMDMVSSGRRDARLTPLIVVVDDDDDGSIVSNVINITSVPTRIYDSVPDGFWGGRRRTASEYNEYRRKLSGRRKENPWDPYSGRAPRNAKELEEMIEFGEKVHDHPRRRMVDRHGIPDDGFTDPYVQASLSYSTDDNDRPLIDNYSIDDIDKSTLKTMIWDAAKFLHLARGDIDQEDYPSAAADFWLTRNGHGAGFWDGDWPEPAATRLTKIAEKFGEFDLYVGDDGKIYGVG